MLIQEQGRLTDTEFATVDAFETRLLSGLSLLPHQHKQLEAIFLKIKGE